MGAIRPASDCNGSGAALPGYIGLEMAEALVLNGMEVSLISRSPQVMSTLDEDMGALVSKALRGFGVTLYLEEALTEFETTAGKVTGIRHCHSWPRSTSQYSACGGSRHSPWQERIDSRERAYGNLYSRYLGSRRLR